MKNLKTKGVANEIDAVLGNTLREIRILKGVSQHDLAQKIGITFQQIQKYERGANRIAASRLVQLAQALDVSIDEFYNGVFDQGSKKEVLDPQVLKIAQQISHIRDSSQIKLLQAIVKGLSKK